MSFSRGRRRPAERIVAVLTALSVVASVGCAARTVPPQPPPGTAGAPSRPSERPPDRTARIYGWVAVSVGAEAAVLALVTSGMMLHQQSVRDGNCDAQKVCTLTGIDANASLSQLGPWNAAAWIVAVAGLGAGGYLLWSHPVESGSRVGVAVDSVGTGAGLGLRSTF